jgi:hypothetical protein
MKMEFKKCLNNPKKQEKENKDQRKQTGRLKT